MSYIDPSSSLRVEELWPAVNRPRATYSASYSDPTFTGGFDSRPYMRGLIVVVILDVGPNITLDVKLQTAPEPFSTYTDISGGAFAQVLPASDNKVITATLDLSKHQNSVGVEVTVGGTGSNRASFGVYAILFPYDTANSGFGSNITNEIDI